MTEERLRELENLYYGMDDADAKDILTEIRRLQAEVSEIGRDRDNWKLLCEIKHAELVRLRPVFDKAEALCLYIVLGEREQWPEWDRFFTELHQAIKAAKAKED